MSEELKAAAERLRKCELSNSSWNSGLESKYLNDYTLFVRDMSTLAHAYLAEHPAGDDVLITGEWIASLNPPQYWAPGSEYGWPTVGLWYGLELPGDSRACKSGFYIDGIVEPLYLDHVKTRGDARRLLRALGVEINE